MSITTKKSKKIKLSEIVQYDKNAKKHPREQIEKIKNSIEEFGYIVPIVIDENNVILMGHGRFKALSELGYKDVEVIVIDGLSENKKKALRIADNKVAESEYSLELLEQELQEIGFDQFAGFSMEELDIMFANKEVFEDDEIDYQLEEKEIPAMERRINEHHDYLVFVFDDVNDFTSVATFFEVKKVNESLSEKKKTKVGVGRILDGKRVLELIKGDKK